MSDNQQPPMQPIQPPVQPPMQQPMQPPMQQPVVPNGMPGQGSPMMQPAPAKASGPSGLGIAALIIGIIAVLVAFIPFLNVAAYIFAPIAIILGIVGIVLAKKAAKSKTLAIVGLVLGAVALVIAIIVHMVTLAAVNAAGDAFKEALDDAATGPKVVTEDGTDAAATGLAVGDAVTLENGVEISLDDADTNYVDTIDQKMVLLTVTYTNNGDEKADYNSWDWKGLNADGNEPDGVLPVVDDGVKLLSSGSLTPGGSVTGQLALPEGTITANYYASLLAEEPTASWDLQ